MNSKLKIFILGLISLLLTFLIKNVNASTYDPSYFKIMGYESIRNNYYTQGGQTIITVNSAPQSVVPIESQNYIELTYCITQPLASTWTISNDSLNGAIVSGNFNYIRFTNVDCALDSYPGKIYRFYLQVYKWVIPSGGSDSYQVSSYLNISQQGYFSIYNLLDIKISDIDNYYNDLLQFNNGVDQSTIINQNGTIISQNDTIINTDISDNDKHLPSKGSFDDFKEAEKSLTDKVKEADTSVLSIGIDSTSSSWVWDTLTSLIKSNTIIFGMFIAILSIGVIKLGLGR